MLLPMTSHGRHLRRVRVTKPLEPGTLLRAKARTQGGFDLHAGVSVRADDRDRLEHLCRYLLRRPLSNARLEDQPDGDVLLRLRRPWSDGTSPIRLSPMELLERLAALIPRPGSNQILYHGVCAANAKWPPRIVPRPPVKTCSSNDAPDPPRGRPNHSWADLLRRGLNIDRLECPERCGGRLRFIAHREKHAAIRRIPRHLGLPEQPLAIAPARRPPEESFQSSR